MKNNNYGLLAGIVAGVILTVGTIGISYTINQNTNNLTKNKKESMTVSSTTPKTTKNNQNNEAAMIAEKFINDYVSRNYTSIENWLAVSTENFRKVYKERAKALELSEALLNEEIKKSNLSKSDKNLLKKYPGIEYDPLLGAVSLNLSPEHSNFKVKSWDEKTGIIILEDTIKPEHAVSADNKPINEKVKLKLIKSKGKWLIDSIEDVNMK